MRIAFLQFGAGGDILMATAIANELRLQYPQAHIDWWVFDCFEQWVSVPFVNQRCVWQLPGPRQQCELKEWAKLKAHVAQEGYDKVVIPQYYPDHFPRHHDTGQHLIEVMAALAGVQLPERRQLVYVRSRSDSWTAVDWLRIQSPGRYVTANTRGVALGAVWTPQEYSQLAARLRKDKIRLVVSDEPVPGAIYCPCSIGVWQGIIARSIAYVGLDSGGSWLAATTTRPQVVLRSDDNENPYHLTGFIPAKVKDASMVREHVGTMSPACVANDIMELTACS